MSEKGKNFKLFERTYRRELADAVYHGEMDKVEEIINRLLEHYPGNFFSELCARVKEVASLKSILDRSSHMEDIEHILILMTHEIRRLEECEM